uniref:Acidic leucine-rich nuclear phosphoprotein 32 family member B-like n=1 Tax=Nicotiana sylvestris TaxID=4096 RepID=A0A1U7W5H4_NICSY
MMKRYVKNSVKVINDKLDVVLNFIKKFKKHDGLSSDEDESNEKHDKSSEHRNIESDEQGNYNDEENYSDRDFSNLSGDKQDEQEEDVELPEQDEQCNKEFEDVGPSISMAPIMDIESFPEEANKESDNEGRAHFDSLPLAMDIDSVHGAQVTQEVVSASGILLE